MASPNLAECRLNEILKKFFPGVFDFNVKAGKRIAGKTPDFISRKGKIVVEMFGDFWHGRRFTGQADKVHAARRRLHFKDNGYKCVIIWEKELDKLAEIVRRISVALVVA